ncbi:hypothetical protein [Gordonia aichiensis]|uniref:hypothetical protein n=1 Tax=Gordonia aichiensis TaxID=36820 RepID=UPI001FE10065|nr:hypothetical protein [Gordonia aichiensis]
MSSSRVNPKVRQADGLAHKMFFELASWIRIPVVACSDICSKSRRVGNTRLTYLRQPLVFDATLPRDK